ncbi:MAG: DUF721 domain-containing protein [Sphingomonadaceae bacterium]
MAKQKSISNPTDRPRGGTARRVSDMVPAVGGAAFARFGFVQSSIVSRWKEIVGDRYAAVSAPESIRFPQGKRADGTLTLMVGGAHAPMMQHVIPLIIERVNRFFGYSAVARVVIRQGEVARPKPRAARPELVALPAEMGDSLRTISDPELKAVLESLARSVATTTSIPIMGKVR